MPILTPIPPQPISSSMVAPRSNQTVLFAQNAAPVTAAGPRFTLADVKISQLSLDLAVSGGCYLVLQLDGAKLSEALMSPAGTVLASKALA